MLVTQRYVTFFKVSCETGRCETRIDFVLPFEERLKIIVPLHIYLLWNTIPSNKGKIFIKNFQGQFHATTPISCNQKEDVIPKTIVKTIIVILYLYLKVFFISYKKKEGVIPEKVVKIMETTFKSPHIPLQVSECTIIHLSFFWVLSVCACANCSFQFHDNQANIHFEHNTQNF